LLLSRGGKIRRPAFLLYGDEIMLVLSRKKGEELIIGDTIKLRVVSITGNRVTLGIEAPREVSILRSEVSAKASGPTTVEVDLSEMPEAG
jgi:carbon storage regulator CsrA